MREVIIQVHCDACQDSFTEQTEGSNRVVITVYGTDREMDICDECIHGTFLQEARLVTRKPDKPFACYCGKAYTSQRGLSKHQNNAAHD